MVQLVPTHSQVQFLEDAGERRFDTMSTATKQTIFCIELIRVWQRRAKQRKELASLDERTLRDIGVSRYDAIREANKPFWKS